MNYQSNWLANVINLCIVIILIIVAGSNLIGLFNLYSLPILAIVLLFIFIFYRHRENLFNSLLRFFNSPVSRWSVLAMVLSCAVPRTFLMYAIKVTPVSDSLLYHNMAASLANGHAYAAHYVALFPHTIGYPLVLAQFYRFFGSDVIIALWVNTFFTCISVWLFYLLAQRFMGKQYAVVAGFIWALWPSHIITAPLVITEPLFVMLMLIALLVFTAIDYQKLIAFSPRQLGILCGAGALFALCNAVRPYGLVLLAAGVLFLFITLWQQRILNANRLIILSGFISFILLLFSYTLVSRGIATGIDTIIQTRVARMPLGHSLNVGFNLDSLGRWNAKDSLLLAKIEHDMPVFDAQKVQNILRGYAFQRIYEQGLRNIPLFFIKTGIFWSPEANYYAYLYDDNKQLYPGFIDIRPLFLILPFLTSLLVTLMAIIGTRWTISLTTIETSNSILFLSLVVCGFTACHLLVEVQHRYNYPASAILPIFIVFGLRGIMSSGEKMLVEK
jgi:4-amino-4-deoxy-L-arabinose transferase-like glycosyltransferase